MKFANKSEMGAARSARGKVAISLEVRDGGRASSEVATSMRQSNTLHVLGPVESECEGEVNAVDVVPRSAKKAL